MNMFKLGVLFAATLTAVARVGAAGADDVSLVFSTRGPDRYSDGSVVQDGECYALVWSADGVFEGFDASGAPLDADDVVVNVGAVARKGRCSASFDVAASVVDQLKDGYFSVYLLDTRVRRGAGVVPAGADKGRPKALNGYGRVAENVSVVAQPSAAFIGESPLAEGEAHRAGSLVKARPGVRQPKILKIAPGKDTVEIVVEDLGGRTRVQGGRDVAVSDATSEAVETDGAQDTVSFVLPKTGNSGFFRAVRD